MLVLVAIHFTSSFAINEQNNSQNVKKGGKEIKFHSNVELK